MNVGLRGYASGVFSTIRNLSTHRTQETRGILHWNNSRRPV